MSFREDISAWVDCLLMECDGDVGVILQSIKESIHLKDGRLESHSMFPIWSAPKKTCGSLQKEPQGSLPG